MLTVSGRGHPIEVRYTVAAETAERRIRTCRRRCSRRIGTSRPRRVRSARATCWCSCPASARSATSAELLERELPEVEVLTLYSRLSWEQQSKIFRRGAQPPHRARDQCRGDLHHRAGHPRGDRLGARADQPLQSAQPPAAPAHRAGVARERRAAQGPLRPARPRACACGCTPRTTSRRGPSSPSRRSCAPTSRRCCCAWRRTAWAMPRRSPSSMRPISRALNDGYRLLQELEALGRASGASPRRGRAMARLPLDPRLCAGAAREQALPRRRRVARDRLGLERSRCAPAAAGRRTGRRRPRGSLR